MPNQADPKLEDYRAKRDRSSTPEPFGRIHIPPTGQLFVVQQHAASHLHFDFRLEIDGVLKSWAIPKGPSDDPSDKRFAAETEDHPLDYADFEGEIPEGNYGAGHVIVWDRGRFALEGDFETGYDKGKLLFRLDGYKLRGSWTLVRMKGRESSGREWLFIKERDAYTSDAGPTFHDQSVLSGLTVDALADPKRTTRRLRRAIQKSGAAPARTTPDLRPMLATRDDPHDRQGWIWELKYDGYRALACKLNGAVTLRSRNGIDLAPRFPEVCQVLSHLPLDDYVIDGEIVVQDASGRPSFSLMQTRARTTSVRQVSRLAIELPATMYCFDLLRAGDHDIAALPLLERKALLKRIVPRSSALIYSEHVVGKGRETYRTAVELGVEGVVGKRADSRYRHGRSQDWVKARNQRTGDFVILGWSPSRSAANDIGSIALGEWRGGALVYAGHVGSGLSQVLRETLLRRLKPRKTPPIADTTSVSRSTHWVRPTRVVEVAFTEYTAAGHVRHPTFVRMRDDKPAAECISGWEGAVGDTTLEDADAKVVVTNPEKIFFPGPGFTKADLVHYYRSIAPWMLPYLKDRPIVLTRYPDGIEGKSFYQRDVPDYVPDWLRREVLWSKDDDKAVHYFIVQRAEDLAYLANMGTIPIHIWHSRVDDLEHPDWCVLDLDPKRAPFADVITIARGIRDLLEEIGLPGYPKTSGASGLHVLIPLAGQLSHEQSQTLGELLAQTIVTRFAEIATIARSVRARGDKVYVDYLQNGHGKLIVAPLSVRAEPSASVSMPLRWSELNGRLNNSNYHIGNAARRLKRLGEDPLIDALSQEPDLLASLSRLADIHP